MSGLVELGAGSEPVTADDLTQLSMAFTLTMDAADPRSLGDFWALALGYRPEDPPGEFTSWEEALTAWGLPPEQWNDAYAIVGDGPRIFIQRVPEPKTTKNRLHIDVHAQAGSTGSKDWAVLRAKAAALVAAGASIVAEFRRPPIGEWIVMTDPEGNEFCIV